VRERACRRMRVDVLCVCERDKSTTAFRKEALVCVLVCVHVFVCVCQSMCERERERESVSSNTSGCVCVCMREIESTRAFRKEREGVCTDSVAECCVYVCLSVCVCVCVCVCFVCVCVYVCTRENTTKRDGMSFEMRWSSCKCERESKRQEGERAKACVCVRKKERGGE